MTDIDDSTQATARPGNVLNYLVIGGLIVAAFFGAYRFAAARSAGTTTVSATARTTQPPAASGAASAGGPGCACCGGGGAPTVGGVTGDPVEGTAKASGGVQTIAVDVAGTYSPNVIKLKAGLPAKITFSQSSGCTAQVISQDLGFQEDLSSGAKTVSLPALKAGTYGFSCGMGMVFGKIVVE